LRTVKRNRTTVAYAGDMERLIDALPWLVTAVGVVIAAAALAVGLMVWWLRHPADDPPERE
jgi:hypothetical protein